MGTTTMTYREALKQGIRAALQADERVFLMGEDVGSYGGCFAVSKGLLDEFGPIRIRDTPLSESGFVGTGIGAAVAGMRPIVEVMTVNFALLAFDQLVNNAATLRHMSGGQVGVPLVVRMSTGSGKQLAAQHSHSWEGLFAHIPGLRVVAPGTHHDARWMLQAALADPDPVVIFEHVGLLNSEGEVGEGPVDIEHAAVRRAGTDVSIITFGGNVPKALAAAEELTRNGIDAEVLDLRTLRPLDNAAIQATASKTGRVVVVDEGWRSVGMSAEIAARVAELAFYSLDAPIKRLGGVEVPIPYAKHLEDASVPQVHDIVAAARAVVGHG